MASSTPLQGIELIDCAQANAREGLEKATYHCGYGENKNEFQIQLKKACQDKGIEIDHFGDLIKLIENQANEITPNNSGLF